MATLRPNALTTIHLSHVEWEKVLAVLVRRLEEIDEDRREVIQAIQAVRFSGR